MYLFLTILIVKSVTISWSQNAKYSLYCVTAFNYYERQALYDLHLKNDNIIFLNGVTNDAALPMDIVVNECCTEEFEMHLQDKYIEYVNIDSDLLQEEFNTVNQHSKEIKSKYLPNISENFLDWKSLLAWVDGSCKMYTKLKKIAIGTTYEKRDMLLLKLTTGGKKPAVFIMGGEQGRDWISTAIVLNFIKYLLQNQKDILLRSFDFYFVPVFNPDGYEFSMEHNRFWSKNRKSFFPLKQCPSKKIAVGVDIDRNWFVAKPKSGIDEECQSVYLGNKCLTEEETKAVSTFVNSIAINLLAFINLRGFENLVTVPYAEPDNFSSNEAILVSIGELKLYVDLIRKMFGIKYNVGNSDYYSCFWARVAYNKISLNLQMEMLLFACAKVKNVFNVTYRFSDTASCFFNFSGNSADWVKLRLNVPIVYTMYMKQEPYIFPHTEHIAPLSKQFTFMSREMLLLGNSIYGPLFSKQTTFNSNKFGAILFCLVHLILL